MATATWLISRLNPGRYNTRQRTALINVCPQQGTDHGLSSAIRYFVFCGSSILTRYNPASEYFFNFLLKLTVPKRIIPVCRIPNCSKPIALIERGSHSESTIGGIDLSVRRAKWRDIADQLFVGIGCCLPDGNTRQDHQVAGVELVACVSPGRNIAGDIIRRPGQPAVQAPAATAMRR